MEQHGTLMVCANIVGRVPCNVCFAPQSCHWTKWSLLQEKNSKIPTGIKYLLEHNVYHSLIYTSNLREPFGGHRCSNYFINDFGWKNCYRIVTCLSAMDWLWWCNLQASKVAETSCYMWHCTYITSSILGNFGPPFSFKDIICYHSSNRLPPNDIFINI